VNWFEQDAQDPLGLTRAEAFTDPESVVSAAENANTRVSRSHAQVGFNLTHAFNENNAINLMTYVGSRENLQILPTNALGTNARASEISREFYGADLRWDNKGEIFNKAYNVSVGLNYGKSEDARLDTNIQGTGLGLNRDEDNIVDNFDQYVQGKLSILDNVDIHAGARHTKVKLKVKDRLTTVFGDNSGSVDYQKTTPVIGAVWKINPALNLYANYGQGFETPTFIEAAYNATTAGATPNLNLKPSESRNFEVGAKAFLADNTQVTLNVFKIDTDDEIVILQTSAANRSVYANANKTKRTGAELSVDSQFANNLSTYFSYSLLNAKFDSDFAGASGLVAAGNRIPGTYRSQIYGEVAWKYAPIGFNTALEGRHNSKVYVNDLNADTASSYTIFNVRAGFEQTINNWKLKEYVRVENMFDKEYIGSVRVNDGNSRFFEPAADRNYLLGLSASYQFN